MPKRARLPSREAALRRTEAIDAQPNARYAIVAMDPSVRGADRKILSATIEIPNEQLQPGPRGYRVQVVDYDAGREILYKADPVDPKDMLDFPARLERDRAFHARNTYAIVMRVLSRFERALGRRVGWSFLGHQLTVAPHAFHDLNAFYSRDDRAIFFGYYEGAKGPVFTCLSHEVVAHETTHALVDGLRPFYTYPSSPDQAAFHEGFADIVALLSVLSLREVVSAALDLSTSPDERMIRASKLTVEELKRGVLLGLAKQLGEAMYGGHGMALRRSIAIEKDPALEKTAEFEEPHRRGELLVAAVLGTFLDVWHARIELFGQLQRGFVSRVGVVDSAVETAERLLTIAIRTLDYCPPTDLRFSDFLSSMLTADFEVYPDDSRYRFRDTLRENFAAFGFTPESRKSGRPDEPGLWPTKRNEPLVYSRTHLRSLQHDKDEVFRFIWENRGALGIDEDAYTRVESVRPCQRIGADGFILDETVAVYLQVVTLQARELPRLGLKRPDDMPFDTELSVYGGGTLVFDEAGRLKYSIANSLADVARQNFRLEYLWSRGNLNKEKSFAVMHLERMLRHDLSQGQVAHAHGEDDADEA